MPAPARAGTTTALTDPTHHVIYDSSIDPTKLRTSAGGVGNLTPRQQADQLIATLLAASGPIVLAVSGTAGTAWEHVELTTARAMLQHWHGAISFASIPYPNGAIDDAKRFLGLEGDPKQNVLAMVIAGLHERAPDRPILIVSESLGSWMVAQTLADPKLAAAVTRAVMFSTPGFQATPSGVGQAADGAGQLPGATGVLRIAHTDDVVPHLFAKLTPSIVWNFLLPIAKHLVGGNGEYVPHHYDSHGPEAAAYLLRGVRPAVVDHPSSADPVVRAA